MKHLSFLFLLLMMLTNALQAQKKQPLVLHWRIAGELPPEVGQPRSLGYAGPLAGVHNNVLLVGGGANFPKGMPWLGGKKKYHDELFVLKKEDGMLRHLKTLRLPFPLAYSASCTTPKGVIAAGGENEAGISSKVLLLQWNVATGSVDITTLPELPVALTNASLVCLDQTVYLAGGETKEAASRQFLQLNLNDTAAGWKELPLLPQPTSHAVLVALPGGGHAGIYLIGGRKKTESGISDLHASVYAFDLQKGAWQQKKSLPYTLSAGTGIAFGTDNILLFGGDKGATFRKTEQLIAAINSASNAAKKEALNRQKIQVQAAHPGFSKEVLLYDAASNSWKPVGCIPFAVPVTTAAVPWENQVFIPGGEIKAGVRTPYILAATLPGTRSGEW